MIKTSLIIKDKIGFHARTAAIFAKAASDFKSEIFVEFNGKRINAKSTLSLMTLGVKSEDKIELFIKGIDQNSANQTLVDLVESNFKN
ncbi:MAG: HPr family phosphocarrier protein [Flavobacteriaceae bacterium]|jgi:phosphotransferase system HPr (HPr) family protein|nr:HPr family phosphocarrier protein [Flavobacteriaceae bacterium]MDG1686814.1 HPr family phosphocarrier protein [Flavobacteriaceae bacterium]MDG2234619.1 HPr family phosphocarrier protein [Flavobacteriaceae bacterium]|tara:strand:- start:1376 stop:1639 length:264 start_codon:yes stop_codon:yes gene_type:complete